MKTKLSVLLISFLFILSGNLKIAAQVTIGNSESPIEGALLQVKETPEIDDAKPNSTKGLAFPRVALTYKSDLRPMFSSGATPDQKLTHTGLVVYNTSNQVQALDDNKFIFREGLYVWNGREWSAAGTPDVKNGITLTNEGAVKLGGDLTDEKTTIDLNQNSLIFDCIDCPDDRNKGLILKDFDYITTDAKGLVVDVNTGKVGLNEGVPANLAFLQSTKTTNLNATTINAGTEVVVPWNFDKVDDGGDLVTNNFVDFDQAENAIVLKEDVAIEMSAYVCYYTGGSVSPNTADSEIVLNATIQIQENGSTDWNDYSSIRSIWPAPNSYYINTCNIPPAMYEGKKGDKIRLIVVRPSNEAKTRRLGGPHNYGGTGFPRITVPWSTKFSKSLKIIAQ